MKEVFAFIPELRLDAIDRQGVNVFVCLFRKTETMFK